MLYEESGGGGSYGGAGKAAAKAVKSLSKKSASRRSEPIRKASRRRSSTSSRSSGGSSGRSYSRSSSSSRGSSGRSGSSGGSSGGGGYSSPAPKKPSVPSLAAYLGTDSVYQGAVRGGKRSLADFISEMGRRRGEANTQFTQTKGSMERDRVTQLDSLRDEFASRGLIQSGLYGEEQGKFQEQFNTQLTSLGQQQAALLADLLSQQKNYSRENDLAMEAAKQEALQRRAAKYKIGA